MRTIIIDDDKASVDTLTKKLKKFRDIELCGSTNTCSGGVHLAADTNLLFVNRLFFQAIDHPPAFVAVLFRDEPVVIPARGTATSAIICANLQNHPMGLFIKVDIP